MCGLNHHSGKIALADTFSIAGNMTADLLRGVLNGNTDKPCFADDVQHPSVLCSSAFSLYGLQAALWCLMQKDCLRTVELYFSDGTAQEQRNALFTLIGVKDPCEGIMRSVLLRYSFGTVWIAADPQNGMATLRITYAAKE